MMSASNIHLFLTYRYDDKYLLHVELTVFLASDNSALAAMTLQGKLERANKALTLLKCK
jgi:hypothetical protein